MKPRNSAFILFFLSLQFANHAFAQGGMGGNGGGVLECADQPLIVLDYDEAQAKSYPLLNVESMSRKKFFDLMYERLKLGSAAKTTGFRANMLGPYGSGHIFGFHTELKKRVDAQKEIDRWPETESWEIKDEFVEGNLKPGCKFLQAAVSLPNTSYRIKSVTDRLSHGQKLVLELHEYLSQLIYLGSSLSVREMLGVLLRKKLDYETIRLAEFQLHYPLTRYYWKKHEIFADETLDDRSGLYALDLSHLSEEERLSRSSCPRWIGIVPLEKGDFVLQGFSENGDEPKNFILPQEKKALLSTTIVSERNGDFYKRGTLNTSGEMHWDLKITQPFCEKCGAPGETLSYQEENQPECQYLKVSIKNHFLKPESKLFPLTSILITENYMQSAYYVKKIRAYFELRRLKLPSEYESEMEEIRERLGW